MIQEKDTIAAISTALSESGIAIIRVSGPDALEITDRIFRPAKKDASLSKAQGYTLHYGHIVEVKDNQERIVDEVLVGVMRAPRSYTAENTAEINCHGGIFSTQKILELVIGAGARPAEPGEFTKRAFLNGRIDLTRAQAVMDVIHSKSDYALGNAVKLLDGQLYRKISAIREEILYYCARIESALDDPEHYDLTGISDEIYEKVMFWKEQTSSMSASYHDGQLINEGINTVIIGKPNAGKSSILNALLGRDRAIVTEIAGTTRDVLTENVRLGPVTLKIADTAGIRDAGDPVERIGVEKAVEFARDADLLLCVLDSSSPLSDEDMEIFRLMKGKRRIILMNKSDLPALSERSEMEEQIRAISAEESADGQIPVLYVSAKTGEGIDQLQKTIQDMFFRGELNFNDEIFITKARQKEALDEASASLDMVIRAIEDGMEEDFYTIDLMDAYAHLGKIIGQTPEDDLADKIFSEFCMGK